MMKQIDGFNLISKVVEAAMLMNTDDDVYFDIEVHYSEVGIRASGKDATILAKAYHSVKDKIPLGISFTVKTGYQEITGNLTFSLYLKLHEQATPEPETEKADAAAAN